MRIGVIGLGHIGGHLAGNLVADEHDVTVFDRDADARTAAEGRGATLASDAAGVAKSTQITLLSLPTPELVSQVASDERFPDDRSRCGFLRRDRRRYIEEADLASLCAAVAAAGPES